ncbi:hypothetical protein Ga0102493_112984 [Erythrobacter litoralis]|uniref:hypothetical protein n=1 Tax=Erythrobacter litoralis TaxID=39960 RepID=UPI000863BAB0|nr:hypothetical protein [Erythrobacter litoralis]AOL23982.1 hypothetical protein Ga0102493_112984 [Erythrobacter litoralis]
MADVLPFPAPSGPRLHVRRAEYDRDCWSVVYETACGYCSGMLEGFESREEATRWALGALEAYPGSKLGEVEL